MSREKGVCASLGHHHFRGLVIALRCLRVENFL